MTLHATIQTQVIQGRIVYRASIQDIWSEIVGSEWNKSEQEAKRELKRNVQRALGGDVRVSYKRGVPRVGGYVSKYIEKNV